MTKQLTASQRTGRKVFWLFIAGFGLIVSVNMGLLYSALGTWPGLETRNAYADSLGFEDRRNAQVALNWFAKVSYENGDVVLSLKDGNGKAVALSELVLIVGRATYDRDDAPLEMNSFQDSYRGKRELPPGNWQVRIAATGFDGDKFRQRLPLIVR